jgi:hypothetical protein
MIVGFPPTIAAAAELLVPKSIPMIFAIFITNPQSRVQSSFGLAA